MQSPSVSATFASTQIASISPLAPPAKTTPKHESSKCFHSGRIISADWNALGIAACTGCQIQSPRGRAAKPREYAPLSFDPFGGVEGPATSAPHPAKHRPLSQFTGAPQYFGTDGSIWSDQASMPPATLLRCLNPCCRKNSKAYNDRTPALQWR